MKYSGFAFNYYSWLDPFALTFFLFFLAFFNFFTAYTINFTNLQKAVAIAPQLIVYGSIGSSI